MKRESLSKIGKLGIDVAACVASKIHFTFASKISTVGELCFAGSGAQKSNFGIIYDR